MTRPEPYSDVSRSLSDELRERRTGARYPGAILVPVEDGEPIPWEEPPAPDPRKSDTTF